jgi:hypothetical protein
VIADALGVPGLAKLAEPPRDKISVDFPAIGSPGTLIRGEAVVQTWRSTADPVLDDVAILRLSEAVPDAIRSVAIRGAYKPNDRFRAYGVRSQLPDGAYVEGRLLGNLLGTRIQIISDSHDTASRPGCSGGAAWNMTGGGVVGMVVEMMQERAGRLIPIDMLAQLFFCATGERITPKSRDIKTTELFDGDIEDDDIVSAVSLLPLGPAVDLFEIKTNLIRAFANGTTDITAPGIVGRANDFVLSALGRQPKNKYAFVISYTSLPVINRVGLLDYWAAVFAQACPLGPRMVGALLLSAPMTILASTKEDVVQLFMKLRRER